MRVLGPGAYGDPERPWLTRDEFDAEAPTPVEEPAVDLVAAQVADVTPSASTEDDS